MFKENNFKIGVIGSGSWATAIVKVLTKNNHHINWWIRNAESRKYIADFKHNPNYLQSVEIELEKINLFGDIKEVIENSTHIIVATPSAFVESSLTGIESVNFINKHVFSAVKGFISNTDMIPAHFFASKFNIPIEKIGVICGPCHAEEVAMERLSYLTIGCAVESNAKVMAEMLQCRFMKTFVTSDIIGVEYSAVLKNVYALAAGISAGLGYGDNFQAILISNSIKEIERFINQVCPDTRDTKESAYLGDLLVTSYSNFSRNRTFGFMIGKGYSVKSAQIEMKMVAEGFYALKSIHKINQKYKVKMPIMDATFQVIYENKSPKNEFKSLSNLLS